MSLDICLSMKGVVSIGSGIFVRENGENREISCVEWDEKFPGREPITTNLGFRNEVYSANITHNLSKMAALAGIYDCIWRPDEHGITKASQLIRLLTNGLVLLQSDPEKFKTLNPPNGWGTYDNLVDFTQRYLDACIKDPDADVSVSR